MRLIVRAVLILAFATCLLQSTATPAQVLDPPHFTVVPTPNDNFNNDLFAASASSPNDIWAVGQCAIHYDGAEWTAVPVPMINGDNTSFLGGVVDLSPTLAWAAGTVGIGLGDTNQVLEQWNGTEWSVYPNPVFGPGNQPELFAMASTSANDIWAVGDLLADDGNALFALFEHWDGTQWSVATLETGVPFLNSASADATNDAWTVGYDASIIDEDITLAIHWNGTSWSRVSTPNVGEGNNVLEGVLALAPNNVWAVGYSTPEPPPQGAATLTLIEHFDGNTWSVIPSPNIGPANQYQSNRLFGLAANSPTDIYAFGSYFASDGSGHQMTLLMHWNGVNWTIWPSPNPTQSGFLSDLLWAGVVPSPGNLWIFGTEDEAPNEDTLAIHF
jgi:hypothetical protein